MDQFKGGGSGQFDANELMLTRFKETTWLRVTPNIAGALKDASENLRELLVEQQEGSEGRGKDNFGKKVLSLEAQLSKDDFWIELLDGVELNAIGTVKFNGLLGFVLGSDWTSNKPCVILEITEETGKPVEVKAASKTPTPTEDQLEVGAVSAAG